MCAVRQKGDYDAYCSMVYSEGKNALNTPKNIKKGYFEISSFKTLISLLYKEIEELEEEIDSENIDLQRVLEESGDIVAIVTGILAKVSFTNQYTNLISPFEVEGLYDECG